MSLYLLPIISLKSANIGNLDLSISFEVAWVVGDGVGMMLPGGAWKVGVPTESIPSLAFFVRGETSSFFLSFFLSFGLASEVPKVTHYGVV